MSNQISPREIRDRFVDTFFKFLERLAMKYPDNKDIKAAARDIKIVNHTVIINEFYNKLCPFKERINAKDENFFLTEINYNNYKDSDTTSEEFGEVITELKKLWYHSSTTDQTKESIWKYLKTLVKLAEKYMQLLGKIE